MKTKIHQINRIMIIWGNLHLCVLYLFIGNICLVIAGKSISLDFLFLDCLKVACVSLQSTDLKSQKDIVHLYESDELLAVSVFSFW